MRPAELVISVFVVLAAGTGDASEQKQTLAIPYARAAPGIPETVVASLSAVVASEASQSPRYRTLSAAEIATLIGFERQKQLLGCADEDTSCVAELAGALGASLLLDTELSKPAERYLLVLRLLDPQTNRVIARAAYYAELDEGALSKAARRATRSVLAPTAGAASATATATATTDDEIPFVAAGRGAPPWIATGGSALLLGAAAAFGANALAERGRLEASVSGQASSLTFPQAERLREDANRDATIAAGAAVAGAAVAAVAVWLWTREDL